MNKNKVAIVIAEMNKLAGRFAEMSHCGITINDERSVLVRPDALADIDKCLTNWAKILSEELE